uniref:Ligand dependent nuclear receptor corepressor n=1 Tax=Pelusios castaneus TaxID=367368 RepID=A0A8C8R8B9_9SAUR
MDASACSSGCSQQSTENWNTSVPCSELKIPASLDSDSDPMGLQSTVLGAPKQPAEVKSRDRTENYSTALKRDSSELLAPRAHSVSPKDGCIPGYLTTSNSSSLNFEQGQSTAHEQEAGVKKCEDNKDQIQGKTLADSHVAGNVANVNGSEDSVDSCLVSLRNSFKALPEEAWDPGFTVSSPRRADKENTLQCSSPFHLDLETTEQDARPKQDTHLHALGKTKGSHPLHPGGKSPCEHSTGGWVASGPVPTMHKASAGRTRAKTGSSSIKTARKSKRSSGLRINDYDNQCDVVYISQPITECHLESQRAVSSRRTARKSTRGYFFNGECCELPTVRTLVRSSRAEERGNGPALRTDELAGAKQCLALSGGEPAEAAQSVGKEADKRASKEVDAGTAEKEPSEICSLTWREAVHPEPRPALSAPPPPDSTSAQGDSVALAGAVSGEPPASPDLDLPATPPVSMDVEPPTQLPASAAVELPAGLQSADGNESMNAAPDAEASGAQESPAEQGEAWLTGAECSELSEGNSRLSELSGTGSNGTISSKENPGKKQRKERRALVASDRRLRSQQFQPSSEDGAEKSGSSTSLQLPCLQIKLSKSPGAKHFRREVHLDGAASVCFHKALLKSPSPEPEQPGEEGNGVTTRQSYKSALAAEGAVEGERSPKAAPPANASLSQSGEMLEIYVEANSEERSVLFPRERGTGGRAAEQSDGKPDDADAKDGEKPDHAVDPGKVQSKDLTESLSSKSGSKHVASKTLKQKRLALPFYNLRHTSTPVDTAKKNVSRKEALQANPNQKEEHRSGNKDTIGLKEEEALAEDKPKFVEWCAEEENQELIADFNAQYMKVQKGWIQLEKEVQPAPKVKNKADKLKEIWKSKKRTRKSRASLEVQKLSPVQMLFMKAFKLSNICRWFLETTETRSLVIVKKLNTRLPGDVPPIKIPLQKYCSSGLYPSSLQAERLKKHLKKFAATTPAKNNLKNQKLWARLRENAEKTEPEEAASPNQIPPCDTSSEEASEDRNVQPPPSLPTQASTRILRKYSNLRGKLRAQHRLVKNEKKGDGATDHPSAESKPSRKSVCINPLMSPKLALQVKADVFPAKSLPVEAAAKGRKGKSRSQQDFLPKADPQPGRRKRLLRESSRARERSRSSSADRLPGKRGSQVSHSQVPTKAPPTRKQAAMARSKKLHKKGSLKEKRISTRQLGKGRVPIQKVKENPTKRAAPPASQEGLPKSPKPKPAGEPSSRSQKAADKKPSSGKTLTRSMKRIQESSPSQGKRKLRAEVDCSHSKRRRVDAK